MRLITGILGLGLLLAAPGATQAARCTDDAAVAAARAAAAGACPCATAENHGQYVKCVGEVVKARAAAGSLPTECKGEVTRCAAKSTCGKPGAVTCCRVDRRGKVKCSIKRSADKCVAPRDGEACVGASESCCDACEGACGGTTTSSTATVPTTTVPTTTIPTTTTTTLVGSPSGAFVR